VAIALAALCNLSTLPIASSESIRPSPIVTGSFEPSAIVTALSNPPIVHPEAQQLVMTFVDNTLPRLIAGDTVLAKQLGFTGTQNPRTFQESGAIPDPPLPLLVVYLKDMIGFVKYGGTHPVELVNKEVNWIKGSGGELLPARLMFPIKLKYDAGNDGLASWSSVIIGKTPSTPWGVLQVGGPKLIRAVKLYTPSQGINFVVWAPGINRHYLGHIGPGLRIILTVLFDDPILGVNAGEEFDPSSTILMDKLKKLAQDIQLQEKIRTPETRTQTAR
jgi:hypothetical protein